MLTVAAVSQLSQRAVSLVVQTKLQEERQVLSQTFMVAKPCKYNAT